MSKVSDINEPGQDGNYPAMPPQTFTESVMVSGKVYDIYQWDWNQEGTKVVIPYRYGAFTRRAYASAPDLGSVRRAVIQDIKGGEATTTGEG